MQQLATWHQTKWGLLLSTCLAFAAAYGVFSVAVNNGALWQYACALVLLIAGIRNIALLIRTIWYGYKAAKA